MFAPVADLLSVEAALSVHALAGVDATPEALGVCDRLGCCCLCVLRLSLKVSAVAAGRFEMFEGLAECPPRCCRVSASGVRWHAPRASAGPYPDTAAGIGNHRRNWASRRTRCVHGDRRPGEPGGAFGDLGRRDVQDQDADLTATSTWVLLIRTPALPGRHPLRQ